MNPFKAAKPGQYIHLLAVALPIQHALDSVAYVGVDSYSRFCFPPMIGSELNAAFTIKHIKEITAKIKKQHPAMKPTFILGYGKEFWDTLLQACSKNITLVFNPPAAAAITLPVVRDLGAFLRDNATTIPAPSTGV